MTSAEKGRYLAAIVLVLASPLLQFLLPGASKAFVLTTAHRGYNFPGYLHHVVYEDPTPLDVAIFGPSHARSDIDVPIVRDLVKRRLGKDLAITHVPFSAPSIDLQSYILEELLARRTVRNILVVLTEQGRPNYSMGSMTFLPHWLDFIRQLPPVYRAAFYGTAALSTPRLLYSWLDQAAIKPLQDNDPDRFFARLGSSTFGDDAGLTDAEREALLKAVDEGSPGRYLFPSDSPRIAYIKYGRPLAGEAFRRMVETATRHGTRVTLLILPFADDADSALVVAKEAREIADAYGISILGLTQSDMKALPGSDKNIYFDNYHLNLRGSQLASYALYRGIAGLTLEEKLP